MNLSFRDKWPHIKYSIKENLAPASLILFFVLALYLFTGLVLYSSFINNETTYSFEDVFVLLFLSAFSLILTIVFFYTIPSSLSYYYDKSIIKKHGSYSSAFVSKKFIEDNSYTDDLKKITEIHYFVEYEYLIKERKFTGVFILENEAFYNLIELNSEIPILLVKKKPSLSKARIIKLGTSLGLSRKESK
jgi:hypothetical protein